MEHCGLACPEEGEPLVVRNLRWACDMTGTLGDPAVFDVDPDLAAHSEPELTVPELLELQPE